jgi:hypothetical protein
MAAEPARHGGSTVEAMTTTRTTTRSLVAGLTGLLLLTAGCAGRSGDSGETPTTGGATHAAGGPGLSKVLFLGDSVAAGEALPLASAFKASGVAFRSIAADGGGNVVGPFADKNWKKLPQQITSAKPGVVVYQITTYDWGSRQKQQAAYRRLLTTVTAAGAKLVFVTAPPIKPDAFYKPHMAELGRTADVARAVAAGSSNRAGVLDAGAVWGSTYQKVRNGKADRSADGIHTCPQGAARFSNWLLARLAKLFPGFAPAAPRAWANTGWSADEHFKGC